MAEVPADFFSPVHNVFGSLAICSARAACCSASACLPFSASSLPCSVTALSLSRHPPPPDGAAGGGGGGGGAPSGEGTGSSVPVTPLSETCAVQAVPSWYLSSWRPKGSAFHPAS